MTSDTPKIGRSRKAKARNWKANLRSGDEVRWNDPDGGICSGVYRITSIDNPAGRITGESTVLWLTNDAGSEVQVYASELS